MSARVGRRRATLGPKVARQAAERAAAGYNWPTIGARRTGAVRSASLRGACERQSVVANERERKDDPQGWCAAAASGLACVLALA